jgi:exonuclease SbcC
MRPIRVEVEGFSAYSEAVVVDFRGVDFFSLSGPTGSGKSSLIDAMVFALFGRVPRLGGNAVAPAITAGADRARVRLDFEIGDDAYTAVRLAQRTSTGGATVKEARLQLGDQVLADGADDVTTAVEELLKLRFDDFTRTVVLPQGEFARFLTATKSERQGLLRNLLGMDVYTRVRELAKTRAAVAGERAEGATRALQALQLADEDEMAAATQRRERLTALAESMTDWEKRLSDARAAVVSVEKRSADLQDAMGRLGAITVPERLTVLDDLIAETRAALVEAEEARIAAMETLRAAEAGAEGLPSHQQIDAWRTAREKLVDLEGRLADPGVEQALQRAEESKQSLEHGLAALERVRREAEQARQSHAAHMLSANLSVGDPCPVCAQEVVAIPDRSMPPGLEELTAEEAKAVTAVETRRDAADEARNELTRIEAARAGWEEQRVALVSELEGSPGEDELTDLEKDLSRLRDEVDVARKEVVAREAEEKRVRAVHEDLADDSRRVAKLLRAAERTVADLQPPLSESDDVVVQWKELLTWRDQTIDDLKEELKAARESVTAAKQTSEETSEELIETLRAHDVVAREPYAVEVATELQTVRTFIDVQDKTARDAAELKKLAESAETETAVASALANHLRANGFEQWLMSSALNDLVSGANELLGQLSGDGYSLHSDESGSFSIVDHRNADEMRSVSTLSGGETFLVSLALALSLAETLASKGGSGLDAIILDEGFGTLDDESLDTVATVLEELTGRGLMVGVITHVKELASRAPVRYEVRRGVGGASVRLAS